MNSSQDELRNALALLSNFVSQSQSNQSVSLEDKIVSNLFSRLDKQPTHEEFSLQDVDESMVDLSVPQTDNTSVEDLTKLVQSLDGSTVTTETMSHSVVPLKRLEKSSLQDLAPSVELSDSFTSFAETLQDVQRVMVLKNAVGTMNVRRYAYRSYVTWYNESILIDGRLKVYQPEPFPIKKATMLTYIYSMRVIHKYAYATVKNVFINELNAYIIDNKLGGNPKLEYGDDLRNLLRSLLRKYGNQVYKVNPLYNIEREKIRASLDLRKELDARTNAVMYFGRAGGNRGDTYESMTLGHLEFKKVPTTENNFVISVYCKIVKDKVLLSAPRCQTIMGSENHSQCPVINLLIYLANHRQVFSIGDLKQVVDKGDFTLKDGANNWPIFSELRSDTVSAKAKHLSFYLIKASENVGKRFSMRSLRSGCVCQAIINSIIRNNRVTTDDYVAIQKHVGWTKGDSAMKEYERMALYRYSNLTDLQEINAHRDPTLIVRNHMIEDGVYQETSSSNISINEMKLPPIQLRKKKIPKGLRDLEYKCNPDLGILKKKEHNESTLSGISFKNSHWDSHWTRRCVERAGKPDCLEKMMLDSEYVRLKNLLAKRPTENTRTRLRALVKLYGNNFLIGEYESGNITEKSYHTQTSIADYFSKEKTQVIVEKKELKRPSLFRDGNELKRRKFIQGSDNEEE